jgi:hypothetical protein
MPRLDTALLALVLLGCRGAPAAVPPECGSPRLDEARVRAALPQVLPPELAAWSVIALQQDACPDAEDWERVHVTLEAAPREGAPTWRAVLTLRLSVPEARLVEGDEMPAVRSVALAAGRCRELEALEPVVAWLARHGPALAVLEPAAPDLAVVHLRPRDASTGATELSFTTRLGRPLPP